MASGQRYSPQFIEFVKGLEGFSSVPYYDGRQYSVGYGTVGYRGQSPITEDQALMSLQQELNRAADSVDNYISQYGANLTPTQREAMISYAFNAGPARAATAISLSANNGWGSAVDNMRSILSKNTADRQGMLNRRSAEAQWGSSGTAPWVDPNQASGNLPAASGSASTGIGSGSAGYNSGAASGSAEYNPNVPSDPLAAGLPGPWDVPNATQGSEYVGGIPGSAGSYDAAFGGQDFTANEGWGNSFSAVPAGSYGPPPPSLSPLQVYGYNPADMSGRGPYQPTQHSAMDYASQSGTEGSYFDTAADPHNWYQGPARDYAGPLLSGSGEVTMPPDVAPGDYGLGNAAYISPQQAWASASGDPWLQSGPYQDYLGLASPYDTSNYQSQQPSYQATQHDAMPFDQQSGQFLTNAPFDTTGQTSGFWPSGDTGYNGGGSFDSSGYSQTDYNFSDTSSWPQNDQSWSQFDPYSASQGPDQGWAPYGNAAPDPNAVYQTASGSAGLDQSNILTPAEEASTIAAANAGNAWDNQSNYEPPPIGAWQDNTSSGGWVTNATGSGVPPPHVYGHVVNQQAPDSSTWGANGNLGTTNGIPSPYLQNYAMGLGGFNAQGFGSGNNPIYQTGSWQNLAANGMTGTGTYGGSGMTAAQLNASYAGSSALAFALSGGAQIPGASHISQNPGEDFGASMAPDNQFHGMGWYDAGTGTHYDSSGNAIANWTAATPDSNWWMNPGNNSGWGGRSGGLNLGSTGATSAFGMNPNVNTAKTGIHASSR